MTNNRSNQPDRPMRAGVVIRNTIGWFSAIGVAAILLGAAGALLPLNFRLTVLCFYGGCVAVLLDLFRRKGIRGTTRKEIRATRAIGTVLVVAAASWFTFGFVLRKAPLSVITYTAPGPHPVDSEADGIRWEDPNATDLRVAIKNLSDESYDNINLVVDTDAYIEDAAQLQPLPKCDFDKRNGASGGISPDFAARFLQKPPTLITRGLGVRVVCLHFPAQSVITLVLSASDKPTGGDQFGLVLTEKDNLGNQNPPTTVRVRGTYMTGNRSIQIDRRVPVTPVDSPAEPRVR